MVHSEAFFHRALVVAVDVDYGSGALLATVSAEDGEWFDPDSDGADQDGWVRNLRKVVAEFSFGSYESTPSWLELSLARLRHWRDERTVLEGIISFERQLIGLVEPGQTGEVVSVQMPPADLDRA